MLWLPALRTVPGSPPLAVSDAAAVALESALLEPAAAVAHLQAALVVDPWFCRWAVNDCPGVTTVTELATALADDLPARLAGLPAPCPCWSRPGLGDAQAFAAQAESICDQATDIDLATDAEFTNSAAADSPLFFQQMTTAPPDYSSQLVVSDYLAEMPGIEWRLPLLIETVAAKQSAAKQSISEQASPHEPDKLAAMMELAYGASHEINNPLANISGRAQSLLRDETDTRRRRMLQSIESQAMRAHEMISDLMLFAHPPALVIEEFDLRDLLQRAIDELAPRAESQRVTVNLQMPEQSVTIQADATQTMMAAKALVENALDAIGFDGVATVELRVVGELVEVRVADTGRGMNERVREHLFDPFFSGREAGRGLGFGLSKCWRIAQLHRGTIELESSGAEGSVFVLRLPMECGE